MKCSTTFKMLIVDFGEFTLNKTRIYERYKRFENGCENIEVNERLGYFSTPTTDEHVVQFKKIMLESR